MTYKSLILALSVLFFAILVGNTNLIAFQGNGLEKLTTETWPQFMARMKSLGEINDAQLQQWQSGNSISLPQVQFVTRTRVETRTRMVPVIRQRIATNDEGQQVTESYTENVAQKLHGQRSLH